MMKMTYTQWMESLPTVEELVDRQGKEIKELKHKLKMEKKYSEDVEEVYYHILEESADLEEKYIDLEVENAKLKDEIEGLEILIEKLQDIILKEDRS